MSERDDDDEHLEGELVVGPEQADDEVLGARRLEVDDDLADRRRRASVAPGRRPASSSEAPSAAAAATAPRDGRRARAIGSTWRRLRPGSSWSAHGGVMSRCRPWSVSATQPRPGPAVRRSTDDRHAERPAQDRVASGPRRSARRPRPARPRAPARGRTRRDLLDVVRDEDDRGRSRLARPAGRGRASSVSRAPRSRLAAGSSRSSRSGSGMSARAIETRRRSPADSVPNGWSASGRPRPGRARSAAARARSASRVVVPPRLGGRVPGGHHEVDAASGRRAASASTALPA